MDKILKDTTCFNEHKKTNKQCEKTTCRYWLNCSEYNNCVIVASESGPKTLQEIGNLSGLTRMRICQIEKSALKKVKETLSKSLLL
jgi:DNA-directed RNA polymerase sigma subunit (sigma70/sigma32)